MPRLEGKVAVVTGGGTGIGRSCAVALAAEGARVAICGRRPEPLESTAQTINQQGGDCLIVRADVSEWAEVGALTETVLHSYGSVDILVNSAAIAHRGYIHEHDIEIWDRVMATKLRAPFLMARAMLPVMRAKHTGHIINISSEVGLEYYEGYGAYGVTKHALVALGEFIQRENQDLGIRVNTICPGVVLTDMTPDPSEVIPEKCLYPEDIADLVIWLATRRSNVKIGRPILIQTMEYPWDRS
jgi:NAD(P)-dependent dehydrogenase (short-subunit alcohol dehydrogenase family)